MAKLPKRCEITKANIKALVMDEIGDVLLKERILDHLPSCRKCYQALLENIGQELLHGVLENRSLD